MSGGADGMSVVTMTNSTKKASDPYDVLLDETAGARLWRDIKVSVEDTTEDRLDILPRLRVRFPPNLPFLIRRTALDLLGFEVGSRLPKRWQGQVRGSLVGDHEGMVDLVAPADDADADSDMRDAVYAVAKGFEAAE